MLRFLKRAGFDSSSTISLRLRSPPLPFHGFTQQFVDPRLVTAPLALQPRQHIGIHANRHRPLDGAVKLPHHGAPPFPYFRRIRQIDLVVRHPRQRRELLCYSPRNLLHRFSLSAMSQRLCVIFFLDLCSPALLSGSASPPSRPSRSLFHNAEGCLSRSPTEPAVAAQRPRFPAWS